MASPNNIRLSDLLKELKLFVIKSDRETNGNFRKLLTKLRCPDIQALRPSRRCILDILGVIDKEIYISNLFAYFFDTKEDHGLKDFFIRALLSCLQESFEGSYSCSVEREARIEGKSLDFLLEVQRRKSNETIYIGIEHKIKAELDNPFKKYRKLVDRKIKENPGSKGFLITLSPKQHDKDQPELYKNRDSKARIDQHVSYEKLRDELDKLKEEKYKPEPDKAPSDHARIYFEDLERRLGMGTKPTERDQLLVEIAEQCSSTEIEESVKKYFFYKMENIENNINKIIGSEGIFLPLTRDDSEEEEWLYTIFNFTLNKEKYTKKANHCFGISIEYPGNSDYTKPFTLAVDCYRDGKTDLGASSPIIDGKILSLGEETGIWNHLRVNGEEFKYDLKPLSDDGFEDDIINKVREWMVYIKKECKPLLEQ